MSTTFMTHRQSDSGELTAFDLNKLPFVPKRIFVVSHVPIGASRGAHAHKKNKQLIFCSSGALKLSIDKGDGAEQVYKVLTKGDSYLHPSWEWLSYEFLLPGSLMISFCSELYDADDYIDNYVDFVERLNKKRG